MLADTVNCVNGTTAL